MNNLVQGNTYEIKETQVITRRLGPEEYPEYVPEKTIWTLHQRVRLDVYDAKTGKCIYSRNEARSDDYAGDGKDIFVKIVRNSFKDFLKKGKK